MQFKLEGQMIARNPEWELDHRRLLHRIDHAAGTIEIDGKTLPAARHATSPPSTRPTRTSCRPRSRPAWTGSGSRSCAARSSGSTCSSCVEQRLDVPGARRPPDLPRLRARWTTTGEFLPLHGRRPAASRARPCSTPSTRCWPARCDRPRRRQRPATCCWYLWCGPRSPLFGKDRIATLENDFVADKATARRDQEPVLPADPRGAVLRRSPARVRRRPERGLIVNGHVPVKIEKGE